MSTHYYVVDEKALSLSLKRVIAAKKLLSEGRAPNASQAAAMAGVSRSVFYKYKDSIRPFIDKGTQNVVTLYALLADRPGVLWHLLSMLAEVRTNVLTVNQSIPSDGTAPLTVSIQGSDMPITVQELLQALRAVDGVLAVDVLSGETFA